jgi:hypothetical protein
MNMAHPVGSVNQEARFEALTRVSRAIARHSELKELFHALSGGLRAAVNFDFLAVFLCDEASNRLQNPVLEKGGRQ